MSTTGHLDETGYTGRELEEMLSPVAPERFAEAHWDRRPLFVKGDAARVERLMGGPFDRAGFGHVFDVMARDERRVLTSLRARRFDADIFRAYFDHEDFFARGGEGARPLVAIRPEQAASCLAAGASLQVNGVEHVPRIGALTDALRAQLRFPGAAVVAATLSPRGRRFAAHFDPGGVLILQTHGRKRYDFSASPVLELPRAKAHLYGDGSFHYATAGGPVADGGTCEPWEVPGAFDGRYESAEMGAGDVLYLPPGVVHRTESLEGDSIAILIGLLQYTFRDLLHDLLDTLLTHDPNWRSVPVWTGPDGGKLPPRVQEFVSERLREVGAVVSSLRADGLDVARVWRELAVASDAWPQPGARVEVEASTRLRLSRCAPLAWARGVDRDGVEGLAVFRGRQEVGVEDEWVPFLARVLAEGRFTAGDATAWAPPGSRWDVVRECLAGLVEQGVLDVDEGG